MYPVAKVDCMYLVDKTASWVLFELDGGIDGRGTAICACIRLGLAFTEQSTGGPQLFLATECYNCCLVRLGANSVCVCAVGVCVRVSIIVRLYNGASLCGRR